MCRGCGLKGGGDDAWELPGLGQLDLPLQGLPGHRNYLILLPLETAQASPPSFPCPLLLPPPPHISLGEAQGRILVNRK